ncbi:hypothetical protein OH77DRAFT_1421593 [Trametes cingulata]|nr:hypothetical protein OH77DRAFT_1421593 [Trametes cingulata]
MRPLIIGLPCALSANFGALALWDYETVPRLRRREPKCAVYNSITQSTPPVYGDQTARRVLGSVACVLITNARTLGEICEGAHSWLSAIPTRIPIAGRDPGPPSRTGFTDVGASASDSELGESQ